MNVKKLRKGVMRTRENEVVCEGPVLYSKQLTGRCEGGRGIFTPLIESRVQLQNSNGDFQRLE
jgi:hypothetical protein